MWHARVVKTRNLAQDLVEAGHVRLNRAKVTKPGHDVAAGDILTIALGQRVLVLKVAGFAERRAPYAEARLLYDDIAGQKEGASEAGNC